MPASSWLDRSHAEIVLVCRPEKRGGLKATPRPRIPAVGSEALQLVASDIHTRGKLSSSEGSYTAFITARSRAETTNVRALRLSEIARRSREGLPLRHAASLQGTAQLYPDTRGN